MVVERHRQSTTAKVVVAATLYRTHGIAAGVRDKEHFIAAPEALQAVAFNEDNWRG